MTPVRHSSSEPAPIGRIVDLLIEKGISQKELTKHLGLHPNCFSEWKSGRKKSYISYVNEIASFFNVSTDYILNGKGSSEEEELLGLFRALGKEGKKKAIMLIKEL